MARARNIKPSFFQNEELSDLTPIERLAFIGMWTISDFKGCFEYRPKRLKIQILPYDNCDIELITINLESSGFIAIYSVLGQQYIKIINFVKHQNPHKNERDSGSEIPDIHLRDDFNKKEPSQNNDLQNIGNNRALDGTNHDQNGTTRADSPFLIPDSLNPIPDESDTAAPMIEKVLNIPFETFWNAYDKKTDPKTEVEKKWKSLKDLDRVLVMEYIPKYKAAQPNKQYRKSPSSFLSKKGWTLELVKSFDTNEKPRTGNVNAAFGNPQMQPPSQEEIDEMAALQAEFKRRHG